MVHEGGDQPADEANKQEGAVGKESKLRCRESGLKSVIKSFDLFGHPVQLNFDQNGPVHKTLLGGAFSIIVRLLIAVYVLRLLKKLIMADEPTTTSVDTVATLDDVVVSQTSLLLLHTFSHSGGSQKLSELRRNVDIYFVKTEMSRESNTVIKETRIEVTNCTFSDSDPVLPFKTDATLALCSADPQIRLQGQDSSPKATLLQFRIDRCRGRGCASDSEIDNYIQQLNIEAWSLERQLAFDSPNAVDGVAKHWHLQSQQALDPRRNPLQISVYLKSNHLQIKDSWLDFGWPRLELRFFTTERSSWQYQPSGQSGSNLYRVVYKLSERETRHIRVAYGILAFIGDLGGVAELLVLVFGFFIYPISKFSFNVAAIEKWFLVRTSDASLFKQTDN